MSNTPKYETRKTLGIIGPVRDQERVFRIMRGTPSNTGDTEYVALCTDCGSVVWDKESHAAFHVKVDSK